MKKPAPGSPRNNLVVWQEWEATPDSASHLGHGVHFHDLHLPRESDLIGFIEGFEWLRQQGITVSGYHIKPNAVTTSAILEEMKSLVSAWVAEQQDHFIGEACITGRVRSCGNC